MKLIYSFALVSFLSLSHVLAQGPGFFEKSFTGETTNHEKFSMYLDSINKYLYRDIRIAESAISECQKMIDQKTTLSDSLIFKFMLQKIYVNHSMAAPLEAYKIIAQYEPVLDSLQLSPSLIASFNYLKGFTYMQVGDLEESQNTFHANLERAKEQNNSHQLNQNLYSLGQLYNDENDSHSAITYFQQILTHKKTRKIRPSTLALVNMELAECYQNLKQYDKALTILEVAYQIAEEADLQVLKSSILLERGKIHLLENKINYAQEIYALLQANSDTEDKMVTDETQAFLALLYRAQKMPSKALEIYKKSLSQNPNGDIEFLLDIYSEAHETCREMSNFKSAYIYLLTYNDLKKKRDEDEKKQKTKYLKIKFDSEQKEQDNTNLTAKILQKQTESKLLYSWLALSFLILFFLFNAFYQKGRYSKKLESEVFHRTLNLRKSNELLYTSNHELQEFNRILSHDLKEPLRSITGFSQLASRGVAGNEKVQEYLRFVIESAEQLKHLIESINIFHKANSIDLDINIMSKIDLQELLSETLIRVKKNHPDRDIELIHDAQVSIVNSRETLRAVFENLLDNAVKYNEQDTVSIQIHHHSKDETHYFEIKDNGIGIDKNYQEQIFGMFKRLNDRNKYKGSGLGLSIAQKLIGRIGGEISILHSTVNKGSTFSVSFPHSTKQEEQISPNREQA